MNTNCTAHLLVGICAFFGFELLYAAEASESAEINKIYMYKVAPENCFIHGLNDAGQMVGVCQSGDVFETDSSGINFKIVSDPNPIPSNGRNPNRRGLYVFQDYLGNSCTRLFGAASCDPLPAKGSFKAINDKDEIAGTIRSDDYPYIENISYFDIATSTSKVITHPNAGLGSYAMVSGITNKSKILGSYRLYPQNTLISFVASPEPATITEIPPPAGVQWLSIHGNSQNGRFTGAFGYASDPYPIARSYKWGLSKFEFEPITYNGLGLSESYINNRGIISGSAWVSNEGFVGVFAGADGVVRRIDGIIANKPNNIRITAARYINNRNQIVLNVESMRDGISVSHSYIGCRYENCSPY